MLLTELPPITEETPPRIAVTTTALRAYGLAELCDALAFHCDYAAERTMEPRKVPMYHALSQLLASAKDLAGML